MKNPLSNVQLKIQWIILIIAVILAIIVGCSKYLDTYTDQQIYKESVSQLKEVSNHLLEKLDVQLEMQWDYLSKVDSACAEHDTMTEEEVCEILAHYENHLAPTGKEMKFRLIDSEGYYYTDEGRQGSWTGLDKLSDDDRQSFLIANWLDNENYMAFVIKIGRPVTVKSHEITHIVLLRSMEDMKPFFQMSAFNNRNIALIVDASGTILSETGEIEGVDITGRNVFHKMEEWDFPHADSSLAFLKEGKRGDTICTDVNIDSQECYVVYNRLPEYVWGVMLLVSKDDVAVSTAQMVTSLLRLFLVIGILLLATTVAAVFFVTRLQRNRKLLALKEQNAKIMADANRELQILQNKTEEARETAEKATMAKSQFLSNMSHDIRTPMNAIVGITALMESDVNNPDKLTYYIKKIKNSSQHMLGLINDILDMSKIESGEVELNIESVKLAEQVGQVESIIRSQSNERNQTFIVSTNEVTHEYLIGDTIRLRQVFLNLLTNAVKYTQEGGEIRFVITEKPCDIADHATIMFSVIDNGYGMTAEFLEHIFEPFVREQDSVTNKIQGTGLGMSITKSIVDLMGGTITVQSEPGKGSRFDVVLTMPVDPEARSLADVDDVLLICNEDELVRNVCAAFREEDVELHVAAGSEQALELLQQKPSDAIIISGNICDENLTDTVEKLHEAAKDAVLVFCCEYTYRENIRQMLLESGVDGLIARPFFFENLILAVNHVHSQLQSAKDEARSPLSGKRFLCAEDNELNAEILDALLTLHNATCTIYPTGLDIVEAFASVKPGEYDAILMDVQMPKMNGMDATRAIRSGANPLGRVIPIIAMTANAFSTDIKDCLDAGMDAHLAKPLDITALDRVLQEITSGGGLRLSANSKLRERYTARK